MMWLEVCGGKAGLFLTADSKDGALTSAVWDWGTAPTSDQSYHPHTDAFKEVFLGLLFSSQLSTHVGAERST